MPLIHSKKKVELIYILLMGTECEVEAKTTGEVEARIIAPSCSTPPAECSKWSLHLLADKAVELQFIDSISHEAVRRLLKKRTEASSS